MTYSTPLDASIAQETELVNSEITATTALIAASVLNTESNTAIPQTAENIFKTLCVPAHQ